MEFLKPTSPLVLIILDGWGVASANPGNAFTLAKTPNFDNYFNNFPHCQLKASGKDVGLPDGQAGNSEVGHLNLGAGKIVYQDLARINMAISDGSFAKNQAFIKAFEHVRENHSYLHLIGLIGPGGVHSYMEHLYSLLLICRENGLDKNQVYLHLFTDGRDSPPKSAKEYLVKIESRCNNIGIGQIASISGRYYAMDRDYHWERTQKVYELLTEGKGEKATTAYEAVEKAYNLNRTDEFILPTAIINKNSKPKALISDNDAVIFFNFRSDRARQLTKAFVIRDFANLKLKKPVYDKPKDESLPITHVSTEAIVTTFRRKIFLNNLFFVTMTEYEDDLPVSAVAFEQILVKFPLAAIFSSYTLHQYHIAETEKYPHVTYFLNGRREEPFPFEDRTIIPSPRVATYDLKPEMSVPEITKELLKRLSLNLYKFIVVNFANFDMVGHTGSIPAAIQAVECVDDAVGKIVSQTISLGGGCIISSDHGNVEEMINLSTGGIDTEHSSNDVPCIIIAEEFKNKTFRLRNGRLADVAPTILKMFKLPKPSEMTGQTLFD